MSAPRTTRRNTAASAVTAALTATLLVGLGGPAVADPPGVDFDPCANTLAQVTQWPGTLGDGSTRFSDGYESYLIRKPACTPGT